MEQPSAASPPAEAAAAPQGSTPAGADPDAGRSQGRPGFGARGRLRRRVRFLRRARELAYRDLGGLVFNLHRFGQRNDELVLAKLSTLTRLDAEVRALESSLDEPQTVTVLREAGVSACPRCAAIHSSEDRFCPACGLPMSRRVDLPIAGPASTPAADAVSAAAGASPQAPPGGAVQPGAPARATAEGGGGAPGAAAQTNVDGDGARAGDVPATGGARTAAEPATEARRPLAAPPAPGGGEAASTSAPAGGPEEQAPSGPSASPPSQPAREPDRAPGEQQEQPTEITHPRSGRA